MDELFGTPAPTTVFGRNVLRHSTPSEWLCNVASAREKAMIVQAVRAWQERGLSQRKAVAAVAPAVPRPTLQGWLRSVAKRDGPLWERVLDGRVPPEADQVPEKVRSFVTGLRLAQPEMPCRRVLELAAERYGKDGEVSERTLRRIWKEEGLPATPPPPPPPAVASEEGTTSLGGGLLLLAAANIETGLMLDIASKIHLAGRVAARDQDKKHVEPETPGLRDERGRLTAAYNHDSREGVEAGDADWRWGTDESKRKTRDLGTLSVLKASPEVLAAKLTAIGACHLLTECRGFGGLTGAPSAIRGCMSPRLRRISESRM